MTLYTAVKSVHLFTVAVSLSLFVLRGLWLLVFSGRVRWRWLRVLPHVNDTVLLASALLLAWSIGQYPFVHHWVTAKVLLLVAYIGLGMVALRHGRTRRVRLTAFVLALVVFGAIVMTALTKNPSPLGWA